MVQVFQLAVGLVVVAKVMMPPANQKRPNFGEIEDLCNGNMRRINVKATFVTV